MRQRELISNRTPPKPSDFPRSTSYFRDQVYSEACQIHDTGVDHIEGKRFEEAVVCFEKVANRHLNLSVYCLGRCYIKGLGVDKNLEKGIKLLEYAAEHDLDIAQHSLGLYYATGQNGVKIDTGKAFRYFLAAAATGYYWSYHELAVYYNNGLPSEGGNIPVDYAKAAHYYGLSVEKTNNCRSLNNLGKLYETGQGVPKNLEKAIECYKKAAEQNYYRGWLNLAVCYRHGNGVQKSDEEALNCYKKVVAHGHNCEEVKTAIKELEEKLSIKANSEAPNTPTQTPVVDKDNVSAAHYYDSTDPQPLSSQPPKTDSEVPNTPTQTPAVDKDNVSAAHYYDSTDPQLLSSQPPKTDSEVPNTPTQTPVVDKDNVSAAHYYDSTDPQPPKTDTNASAANNSTVSAPKEEGLRPEPNSFPSASHYDQDASGLTSVGPSKTLSDLYEKGLSCQKRNDFDEAFKCFREAADGGLAIAQRAVAIFYRKGMGVKKNYQEALKYYELAAKQNLDIALFELGCMYANGECVQRDYKKAFEHSLAAANLGYYWAYHDLAIFYEKGQGVQKDCKEAAHYYALSSEKTNNCRSQTNLGKLYEDGMGVEKNCEKAVNYYQKAAKSKYYRACYNLGVFYESGKGVAQNLAEALRYYELALRYDKDGRCLADTQLRIRAVKNLLVQKSLYSRENLPETSSSRDPMGYYGYLSENYGNVFNEPSKKTPRETTMPRDDAEEKPANTITYT